MEQGRAARAEPRAELGKAPNKTPNKTPDIEAICARLSEVREQADRLRVRAREVEVRILGPQPADDSPAIAAENVPCLTGVIGSDTREAELALREVSHSLDRIYQELGSIGQE